MDDAQPIDIEVAGFYRSRNIGIDFVKAIAALGVVVLHFIGPQAGLANAAVYLLASFSIPVFIMCNGYFVLNKPEITWGYSARKAMDFLAVAFMWCVVNWALLAFFRHNLGNWGLLTPIHDYMASALQHGDDGILWYLWMLAVLELLAPGLKIVFNRAGRMQALAILFGACICLNTVSVFSEMHGGMAIQAAVPQTLRLWTWVFYYVLGGVLGNRDILAQTRRRNPLQFAALLSIGAAWIVLWGFRVRWCMWGMDKAEYLYDDPSVMLLSASLILLCDAGCAGWSNEKISRMITQASAAGLGIYTLQLPVRAFLRHFYQLGNSTINFLLVPVAYLVLLTLSLLLGMLPVLNRLVQVGGGVKYGYMQNSDRRENK